MPAFAPASGTHDHFEVRLKPDTTETAKRDSMKKLLIVAFLTLTALPIHAAEEAEALSPFAGNLGNAIWTLAIFVIVVIVLGKFAWGPVLGLLQQREEFIHRALSDAKRQIQLQTNRALEQIRREAVDLSVMIASKIIQRNLSKEDNERLIDEALKQVEGRAN